MFAIPFHHVTMSLATTKKKKQHKLAWSTLIGTWGLIAVFTWVTSGFVPFFHIAAHFLTGELAEVRSYGAANSASIIAATVVVLLPMLIAVIALLSKRIPSDTDEDINATRHPERRFVICMFYVFGENIVFRFLPLGVLRKIPGLDSDLVFYLLFLTSTSIFAVAHWRTFDEEKRTLPVSIKLLLVLPQFIGGLFFSMIYVSHGFFTTLLAHIIYDTVVFSAYNILHRFRDHHSHHKVLYCYHLLWLAGGLCCFLVWSNHSFCEIWQLLTFQYDDLEWRNWNYNLVMAILFLSFYSLLLEILQYDHEKQRTLKLEWRTLFFYGVFLSFFYPALQGMEKLFPGHFEIKAVCIAILLVSQDKTRSSSNVARLVWKSMLISQLLIIMDATNIVSAFILIALFITYQAGVRLTLYSMHFFSVRYTVLVTKIYYWLRLKGKANVVAEDVESHMRNIPLMLASLHQQFPSDPSSVIREYGETQILLLSCMEEVLQKKNLTREERDLCTNLSFLSTSYLLKKIENTKEKK